MMYKKLNTIPFTILMDCFMESFQNYFITISNDYNYYREKWRLANVIYDLSYGVWDKEKLVGFIINAVDNRNNMKTAFNTGTGLLPHYRGRGIIKDLYKFVLSDLKNNGIEKCSLEVIKENQRAIRLYKNLGFKVTRNLNCFKGILSSSLNDPSVKIQKIPSNIVEWDKLPNQKYYSWNNHGNTLKNGNYSYYEVTNQNIKEGYFVINPQNRMVKQCESFTNTDSSWIALFSGIQQFTNSININNIDVSLSQKIKNVENVELVNTVQQFEMEIIL